MTTLTTEEIAALLEIAQNIKDRQRQAQMEEHKRRFEEWLAQHPLKEKQ